MGNFFKDTWDTAVDNPMATIASIATGNPMPLLMASSSAKGVEQTNAINQAEAQKQRDFTSDQALRQMDFQERMANTAHQRQISDLKRAGLNPILAAGGSGASSPGGASGSGTSTAPAGNKVQAALDMNMQLAQIANTKQNTALGEAQANLVGAQETVQAVEQQRRVIEMDILREELKRARASGKLYNDKTYGPILRLMEILGLNANSARGLLGPRR